MQTLYLLKKSMKFFMALTGLLFMNACSDEMAGGRGDDSFVEFSFVRSPVETRASVEEDGSGSFTDGDKIDLYSTSASGAKHFLLTMKDGQWKPQIPRSQLGEGDVTLTGYYPAKVPAQEVGKDYHHAVSIDQIKNEDFTASDLLRGSAQIAGGKTFVQMDFFHAMHRIRVNVEPQAGSSLPADLKVEVLSKRAGSISETGEAEVDASTDAEWITAHAAKEDWKAIIFPQSTEPYKSQGWIRLSTGGKSSMFELPEEIGGKPFTRFEAGKEVTVNLTLQVKGEGTYTLSFDPNGGTGEIPPRYLKPGETTILPNGGDYYTRPNYKFFAWQSSPDREGVHDWVVGQKFTMPAHDTIMYAVWRVVDDNVGGACEEFKNTTQWVKGIKIPKKEDWLAVYGWEQTEGIDNKTVPNRPGQGWYDCDQFRYNMCWAAGTSDVLHWWLDRNKEYVERYGYTGPTGFDFERRISDIYYDCFIPNWDHDNGGYMQNGYFWFLVGNDTNNGGGYFKDVFEGRVEAEHMVVTGNREGMSRKYFNEYITKAFKNDMGIGLTMPFLNRVHQYVVWGAEYDENGYIKGVYYVNPNDSSGQNKTIETNEPLGLLYMDIVYLEDGGTYTSSSMEGYYIAIKRIDIVGVSQDVWEDYFRTHPDK